jgi:hypothetical protein
MRIITKVKFSITAVTRSQEARNKNKKIRDFHHSLPFTLHQSSLVFCRYIVLHDIVL